MLFILSALYGCGDYDLNELVVKTCKVVVMSIVEKYKYLKINLDNFYLKNQKYSLASRIYTLTEIKIKWFWCPIFNYF